MGITKSGKLLLDIALKGKDLTSVRMFEFGNQHGMFDALNNGVAKTYYTALGVDHVSVDLNGHDGALKRDMTADLSDLGLFDVVTDFGSTEHIEPLAGHYKAFKNFNLLCKVGGFIIHNLPPAYTEWVTHSPAQYTPDFFFKLGKLNGYEIMFYNSSDDIKLIGIVYKKTREGFIEEKDFPYDEIVWDDNKERGYPDFTKSW